MSGTPSVAVLMATYNGENYIEAQISSIIHQTIKPSYIMISDDLSTDRTYNILDEAAQKSDIPIQLRRNVHRMGYSDNFLSMMKECSADIVFLSDQDDVWSPNKVERVLDAFGTTLLITHDLVITRKDINDVLLPSYFSSLDESCIPPSFNVKGCALAYKRDLIDVIGWPPEDGPWTHDVWVCVLASALGLRGFVHEPLMRHRIHGQNVSGFLFTERSTLKKAIRQLDKRIWPTSEMDYLISTTVFPNELQYFLNQMQRLINVSPERARAAIDSARRKQHIVQMQKGDAYRNPIRRTLGSVVNLLQGNYRSFGNLSGFFADLAGARIV